MCDSLVPILLPPFWAADMMVNVEAATLELELKAVAIRISPPVLDLLEREIQSPRSKKVQAQWWA